MKRTLLNFVVVAGVAFGGFLLVGEPLAGVLSDSAGNITEQWVSPTMLRVRVNGKWEEVPLVGLAPHLCETNNPLFDKFCDH